MSSQEAAIAVSAHLPRRSANFAFLLNFAINKGWLDGEKAHAEFEARQAELEGMHEAQALASILMEPKL